MKSVSTITKILIGLLLLFPITTFGQANQEKIQGTWKVDKIDLDERFAASEKLANKVIGTIFRFDDCLLTISKDEKGVIDSKSGTYSLIGNRLTIGGADQPAAEILLLNETKLTIKLPRQQGILYFSKN